MKNKTAAAQTARPNNKTNKINDKTPKQLATPTGLKPEDVREIVAAVNPLIADAFALYLKTKNLSLASFGIAFPRISFIV